LKEKERCKKCKGDKVVKVKTRQEIFIEKGMSDGQRIVLAGAGDQEPGVPTGDVVFLLKAIPHESFERSGNDLLTHITITLSEALLGFSRVIITHLDGRGIKLSTPPGKIIKPQDSIVLRGEGMPLYRRPDEKGDLYVLIDIEMPDQDWLSSIDRSVLVSVLPPKRTDVDPQPDIVDEANFEESDIVDFGGDENWEDEDDDDDDINLEPECRPQ
jgi:DnaJ family protein A protein 2